MVKADVRRDYYADLELPPAATADEIRKQFKKLGMGDRSCDKRNKALM